jgi:hypothetical protein
MIKTNLYTDNKFTLCQVPATKTSDTNCTAVDMQGYNECLFAVSVGNSGDTLDGSNYIELEVEESTDNSSFTDVANADLIKYVTGTNTGTFAKVDDSATEDQAVYFTSYRGTKRYVRVVLNFTGTHSSGTPISVLAIQSANCEPVNTITTQ